LSALRARCPVCDTLTAVALDDAYECHVCGRRFSAGLVRVVGAWGTGGEPMAEAAASLALPWPEAAVVSEPTLTEQIDAVARSLPAVPLVLGGCCCAHVGAIIGLAARHERLAVAWFDAHGDLNTPETSPSGNEWGMPLRMAIDAGTVLPGDVAVIGARSLDPPEVEYMTAVGIDDDAKRAVDGADAVYIAFDVDVLDAGSLRSFMPEPGGPTVDEACAMLERLVAEGCPVAGLGFSGTVPASDVASLVQLASAAGL
jgi:arginase family enzyme